MSFKGSVGARWDDAAENGRFREAARLGLVDYVEVNYPISAAEAPEEIGLPIIAHTSNNALCSGHGIDFEVASRVKLGADSSNSPWVGEHLALLGFEPTGALGYVINPLFIDEFAKVSIANVLRLSQFYERKIALELGPLYTAPVGDFRSELEFLGHVAKEADAHIILDIAHWTISNRNLRRPADFGLHHLPMERVLELHVAGMRRSASGDFWHDSHGMALDEEVLALLSELAGRLPNLQAVTLEHSIDKPTEDFLHSLEQVRSACGFDVAVRS